eukprot:GILI01031972.1.p1 GENE.GILI01031972.1~~GILI01031972.1.p1  ORF type:complete len:244 (-),score=39.67 GILI01031972.1:71-802(-)
MSDSNMNFSIGGFSLKKDAAAERREAALHKLELRNRAQSDRQHTLQMRADQNVMKIASVNMSQWEIEKEKRVKVAFDRIIEKDWYDKYELNLKASEQNHINAVREHFSMRRDKIKTPAISADWGFAGIGSHVSSANTSHPNTNYSTHQRHGNSSTSTVVRPNSTRSSYNNTINTLQWAENIEALDQLGSEGNFHLQDRFMKIVDRKTRQRKRAEAEAVFAAERQRQNNYFSLYPSDMHLVDDS